ncbi:MAG: aminotransferase class V-fold PLP-dependent enzyme [Candidatus Eremiobacteraeota bacterium]|nr:aminotransferase class V-fold PLP-dependent enzyme [Candidatus Eremiobacteraeota bacterium]
MIRRGLDGIAGWEQQWRPFERAPALDVDAQAARAAIDELARRLHNNYPFFHSDYAGQMLKPPHEVALAAYVTAARINPNNHALDGGPATAALEHEAVAELAHMFGYREYLGHLTSSGTVANLEALWVASRLKPETRIAFSSEAHYTQARMCDVIGARTTLIPVDARGRMDLDALARCGGEVGTVVVTPGTTAAGAVDAVDAVVALARERGWRVHADASYGGFFSLIANEPAARLDAGAWAAIKDCDSVAIDPHKHGLQPYGCGCVLFADPRVGALYKHDSPYTYFSSGDLHLGEISLECSRAGAAAAALWTTLRVLPLRPDKGLGPILLACRLAALAAHARAQRGGLLTPVIAPALDIIALAPLRAGERASARAISQRTEMLFSALMADQQRPFYIAKWRVAKALGLLALPDVEWDDDGCTVVRCALMKPEHGAIVNDLIEALERWPLLRA